MQLATASTVTDLKGNNNGAEDGEGGSSTEDEEPSANVLAIAAVSETHDHSCKRENQTAEQNETDGIEKVGNEPHPGENKKRKRASRLEDKFIPMPSWPSLPSISEDELTEGDAGMDATGVAMTERSKIR
jgi:hypothetical protein